MLPRLEPEARQRNNAFATFATFLPPADKIRMLNIQEQCSIKSIHVFIEQAKERPLVGSILKPRKINYKGDRSICFKGPAKHGCLHTMQGNDFSGGIGKQALASVVFNFQSLFKRKEINTFSIKFRNVYTLESKFQFKEKSERKETVSSLTVCVFHLNNNQAKSTLQDIKN